MDADVREEDEGSSTKLETLYEADLSGILANAYNEQPSAYHASILQASNSNSSHSNGLDKGGLETLDDITLLLQIPNLCGTSSKDKSSSSLIFSQFACKEHDDTPADTGSWYGELTETPGNYTLISGGATTNLILLTDNVLVGLISTNIIIYNIETLPQSGNVEGTNEGEDLTFGNHKTVAVEALEVLSLPPQFSSHKAETEEASNDV